MATVEAELAAMDPDMRALGGQNWSALRGGIRQGHKAVRELQSSLASLESDSRLMMPDAIEQRWAAQVEEQMGRTQVVELGDLMTEWLTTEIATTILPPYKEQAEQERLDWDAVELAVHGYENGTPEKLQAVGNLMTEPRYARLILSTRRGEDWRRVHGLTGMVDALEGAYERHLAAYGTDKQKVALRARGNLPGIARALGLTRHAVGMVVKDGQASRQKMVERQKRFAAFLDGQRF
jgi:hypothetical protein